MSCLSYSYIDYKGEIANADIVVGRDDERADNGAGKG
jgi:hypothetical protein